MQEVKEDLTSKNFPSAPANVSQGNDGGWYRTGTKPYERPVESESFSDDSTSYSGSDEGGASSDQGGSEGSFDSEHSSESSKTEAEE